MGYHVGQIRDSLINLMAGFGVPGRDKAASGTSFFQYTPLTQYELECAYRANWIARKLIDIPAQDATRAWRAWQADTNVVELLEEEETRLDVQVVLKNAMIMARLYGGAAIILGVKGGMASSELNYEEVGKGDLEFITPVSRWALGHGPIIKDAMDPLYGKPEYFTRNMDSGSNTPPAEFQIHPSRVIMLKGMHMPDPVMQGEIWGDPVLQNVQDAVHSATLVTQSIATLVTESKFDIIKIPDLSQNIATAEYQNRLTARFVYANSVKSVINTLLLDKEEEWERINANFTQLPDVLQMYLLIASGAADIPATRMLGQSPAGLQSTGDSDVRNYYDRINSDQTNVLSPALAALDDVLIRSALGDRDPSLYYIWNPLWQMPATEKAQVQKLKADSFNVDIMAGAVDAEALRIGRQNQLIEDGTYPGLEQALEQQEQLDLESMQSPEEQEAQAQAEMEQQAQLAGGQPGAPGQPGQQGKNPFQQGKAPQKKGGFPKKQKDSRPLAAGRRRMKTRPIFARRAAWLTGSTLDFNPNHDPSSGEFTSGSGGSSSAKSKRSEPSKSAKSGHREVLQTRKKIGKTPGERKAKYETLLEQVGEVDELTGEETVKHPGRSYSDRAVEDADGIIHTDDTSDVVRALYEGRKVNMVSEDMVSTSVKRLGLVANRMVKMGANAKTFDLCNATVEGTNLFCAESKGIPRAQMPQLKGVPKPNTPADKLEKDKKGEVDLTDAFRAHVEEMGFEIDDTEVLASHLKASQNELNGQKIAGMAGAMREGKMQSARLFVSDDNYIVDGHHTWAANVAVDYDDNKSGDVSMPVARINMSILELLEVSNQFAREMGIPQAAVGHVNPKNAPAEKKTKKKDAASPRPFRGPLSRLIDYNQCHDPETGEFCSEPGAGGGEGGKGVEVMMEPSSFAGYSNVWVGGKLAGHAQKGVSGALEFIPEGGFAKKAVGASQIVPVMASTESALAASLAMVQGQINKITGTPGSMTLEQAVAHLEKVKAGPQVEINTNPGGATWEVKVGGKFVGAAYKTPDGKIKLVPTLGHALPEFASLEEMAEHLKSPPPKAKDDTYTPPLIHKAISEPAAKVSLASLPEPLVRTDGGEWNQETSIRLAKEHAARKVKLEQDVQNVLASGTVKAPISGWEDVPSDVQSDIETQWKENNFTHEHDNAINNWLENDGQTDASMRVASDFNDGTEEAWVTDVIDTWLDEREDDPVPFSMEELRAALEIEVDTDKGYGEPDIVFKWDRSRLVSKSYDPAQQTLPGIQPVDPSAGFTPAMQGEIESLLLDQMKQEASDKLSGMEPPSYLKEEVNDNLNESWSQMDDEEKYDYGKQSTSWIEEGDEDEVSVTMPDKLDPLNDHVDENYRKTQRLAKALSVERGAQLIKERGLGRYDTDDEDDHTALRAEVSRIDDKLWAGWVSSSTGPEGVLLQLAAAEELGGRINEGRLTSSGYVSAKQIRADADSEYADIGGYEGIKAYVRAKWEVTQELLDRAGIQEVKVYRAIHMPEVAKNNAGIIRDAHIERNGLASFTTDHSVANGWGSDSSRVALRAIVPRTAIISVPAYGKNIHSEHEVVVAGTGWTGWDAWSGDAPRFEDTPMQIMRGTTEEQKQWAARQKGAPPTEYESEEEVAGL